MKALSHRGVVIAGIVWLLGSSSEVLAGDLRHLPGHRSGCNCGNSMPVTVHATPVYGAHSYGAPVVHSVPIGSEFHGGGHSAGGGLTGFEGLPNMDGGGINHRYPYHSYRRPWAHPGPPSTNVSIVW